MQAKKNKAIIILGGGMAENPDGTWRTTNYKENDNFGALGDRMRVVAASYLYKDDPSQIIFALGGKGQMADAKRAPAVSGLIKQELIQIGVPRCNIITEAESKNTFGQLQAVKKIVKKYKFKKIIIISNKYHLPRIEAMFKKDEALKSVVKYCQVELTEAEKIVIKKEPWQKKEIDLAYKSKAMQKRIASENKGVIDINKGRYQLK